MSFGQADFFLAVTLVEFQIESRMVVVNVGFAVPCAAAITDQDVVHHGVKNHIDRGEDEQNAKSPDWFDVRPRDRAENASGQNHQQPKSLRKILLPPEVFVAAAQASFRAVVFNVGSGDLPCPVLIRTRELARPG